MTGHSSMVLFSYSASGRPTGRSRVRRYLGIVPCNDIPATILTDHPDRVRAMFIESANPVHSLADSGSGVRRW